MNVNTQSKNAVILSARGPERFLQFGGGKRRICFCSSDQSAASLGTKLSDRDSHKRQGTTSVVPITNSKTDRASAPAPSPRRLQ
jgi:hypothetical protein